MAASILKDKECVRATDWLRFEYSDCRSVADIQWAWNKGI